MININNIGGASGMSPIIRITSEAGSTLTCGSQTYTLGASETVHDFKVSVSATAYTCTATLGTQTATSSVLVDTIAVFEVTLSYSRLPSGWQEVEYIQSSVSTQYINTGFCPTNKTKAKCKFNKNSSYVYFPIGCREVTNYELQNWRFWQMTSSMVYADIGDTVSGNNRFSASWVMPNNTDVYYEYGNRYIKNVDTGTYISQQTAIATSFTYTIPLCLFIASYPLETTHAGAVIVYEAEISDDDVAVRTLVPCYCTESKTGYKGTTAVTVPANTAGMYDLVNDRFYVNCGSGTDFTVGDDV